MGIVDTHLDDTFNQERLAMKGYEFIKCNHPSNIKGDGVGLYIKDTLPKRKGQTLQYYLNALFVNFI